jgi:hypothetical protein
MLLADAMIALNASLEAQACCYLSNTYRDGIDPDVSMYYKISLDRAKLISARIRAWLGVPGKSNLLQERSWRA